ncbi:ImmA/IrrE family metallo-endopeptidase [Hymenobacter sp. HD11105]
METVELNINRLNHLMSLYRVTKEDVLQKLNEKRKKLITEQEVFSDEIKVSLLKKIDQVFNKGLAYYIDPKDPAKSTEESIFFRKDNFNASLTLGAKQIVNKFEEDKISFTALAKLADFKLKRQVPVYKLNDKPEDVAEKLKDYLYPEFDNDKRTFLKNFISKLAEFNILVFEFVETHNKKEKANINGLFLAPNVIVLKRNQKAFRREIFTLAHELGHYLLNEEEIDGNVNSEAVLVNKSFHYDDSNEIENWCNNFAFYFLIGNYKNVINNLSGANSSNDYHHGLVDEISQNTHLSELALYTRFLIKGIISSANYINISNEIQQKFKAYELALKQEREIEKQKALDAGKKLGGQTPKPIISPLYLRTLQGALYNGLINESEFCRKLNINPNKLDKYLI